jgi:signal transduction histidine kinase
VFVSVRLVSNDSALAECCRDVLAELFGSEWALVSGAWDPAASTDHLCIWDFTPGETVIPQDLWVSKTGKHWFLVQKQDVTALLSGVGTTEINVLLKPVTHDGLVALLTAANWHSREPNDDPTRLVGVLRVERDQMLRFLIQANLRVQECDQERNNFLARSVHDFHPPLTAISGYCSMLLEEELGPLAPEQRKVLERMLHSTSRLARISDGMFQLTIPNDTDHGLKLKKANLCEVLDQALHELAVPFADKRIFVDVEIAGGSDGLLFEESQIKQTLVYLLDNACKFTPRDGKIRIRGRRFFWDRRTRETPLLDRSRERRTRQIEDCNSFRLDIRDSGPGIPTEHVERIFEQYTSYGGGQDRSGGGLSLAICRMILNRHQGRIWAESSHMGAVFSLVLPLHEMAARFTGADNRFDAVSLIGTMEK